MWKFLQSDKNGRAAEFEDGRQQVGVFPSPPLLSQKSIIFKQKLTTTGISTGSDDMGIDGSGTAVPFWIPAHATDDIYITNLSIICGYGADADLFEFADKDSALTNGVLISYDHPIKGSVTIGNPKVNYDFIRLGLSDVGPDVWQMQDFVANNDYGFIVTVPLAKIMPPFGIKLDRGTNQKLSVTVRDDCSDADLFNMEAFGFKRFE